MKDGRSFPSTASPQFGHSANPAGCGSLVLAYAISSALPHLGQTFSFTFASNKKGPDFSPDRRSGPSDSGILSCPPTIPQFPLRQDTCCNRIAGSRSLVRTSGRRTSKVVSLLRLIDNRYECVATGHGEVLFDDLPFGSPNAPSGFRV